ncbi:hypothetical protein RSAG8_05140, partial [Rhizoctonia solani AG-8 WAC10335]
MYPKKPGILPAVLSKDIPIREPVLEATSALDMLGIQECILDQLAGDMSNISPAPEKLLQWGTRFDHRGLMLEEKLLQWGTRFDHRGLMLEGLRIFVYRRLPLSPGEVITLGEHASRVMFARERIRIMLLSQPLNWLEDEIYPHNMCSRRPGCRTAVLKAIIQNLTVSPNKLPKDDTSDIFQVASDGLCARCQPIRVEVARALKKGKLDGVVQESSQGHGPDHD